MLSLLLGPLVLLRRIRLLLQLGLLLSDHCVMLGLGFYLSEGLHLGKLLLLIGFSLGDVGFDLLGLELLTILRG